MTRIVYVTSSYPFGPFESFLTAELEALTARGADVSIYPIRHKGPRRGDCPVPVFTDDKIPGSFERRLAARARGLMRLIIARPGLTHNHLASAVLGGRLARYVTAAECDHIHAYWSSVPTSTALIASWLTDVPVSMTLHRWELEQDNALAMKLNQTTFCRTISKEGFEAMRSRSATADIRLMRIGVSVPPLGPEPARSTFEVACTAFLVERKGHDDLLNAWHRALPSLPPGAALVLMGDGAERARLEALVNTLGIGNSVTFCGNVAHTDLLDYYESGSCAASILTSHHEGVPVSLMEAMARGVPVISTEVGGVADLLGGGAGLLVPDGDVASIAGALVRLANDRQLQHRLRSEGFTAVDTHFNADRTAEELLELIESTAATGAN